MSSSRTQVLSSVPELLQIRGLSVGFRQGGRLVPALSQIDLTLGSGEILGLVGESGCGKSLTALAILRLLPPAAEILQGQIRFQGTDLLNEPPSAMRRVRGGQIGMIFQEPAAALNPLLTVEAQIQEAFKAHLLLTRAQRHQRAIQLLEEVGLPDPVRCLRSYPHQLSGGMRQRVLTAIALACEPDLLVADEPTTALDVTVQAQILDLLNQIRHRRGLSIVFISHDLGVIAQIADRVAVMYAGQILEEGPVGRIFHEPCHPYTQRLLACLPRVQSPGQDLLPTIEGRVPPLGEMPEGCRFHPRCPEVEEECRRRPPELFPVGEERRVRCLRREHLRGGAFREREL